MVPHSTRLICVNPVSNLWGVPFFKRPHRTVTDALPADDTLVLVNDWQRKIVLLRNRVFGADRYRRAPMILRAPIFIYN